MARLHGKRGIVYLGIMAGADASPIAFLTNWNIDFTPEYADTTTITDRQRISTVTTEVASGDFTGFFDDATAQSYKAARDGVPRNFYLYPSTDNPAQFFAAVVNIAEFDVSPAVGDAAAVKSSWTASGPVTTGPDTPAGSPHAGVAAVSAVAPDAAAAAAGASVSVPAGSATILAVVPGSFAADSGTSPHAGVAAVSALAPSPSTSGQQTVVLTDTALTSYTTAADCTSLDSLEVWGGNASGAGPGDRKSTR